MSTEDWNETLRRQAEATRDHLADQWERIDGGQESCDDCGGHGAFVSLDGGEDDPCATCDGEGTVEADREQALQELADLPLELVWERGEPFAVVLGTGGPHVEITGGGRSGGYVLTVYWSGTYTLRGEAITRTGEYFRELLEESGMDSTGAY